MSWWQFIAVIYTVHSTYLQGCAVAVNYLNDSLIQLFIASFLLACFPEWKKGLKVSLNFKFVSTGSLELMCNQLLHTRFFTW